MPSTPTCMLLARRLAGNGLRWLPADAATQGWALASAGYVEAVRPAARFPVAAVMRSSCGPGVPPSAAPSQRAGGVTPAAASV